MHLSQVFSSGSHLDLTSTPSVFAILYAVETQIAAILYAVHPSQEDFFSQLDQPSQWFGVTCPPR